MPHTIETKSIHNRGMALSSSTKEVALGLLSAAIWGVYLSLSRGGVSSGLDE